MVDIPRTIHDQILCTLRETDPHLGDFHPDSQALSHGAIVLMATLGIIWGLRPDGTFWKFDADCDLPLTPLEEEWEIPALRVGTERYQWLSGLIPHRPWWRIKACSGCDGSGWVIKGAVVVLGLRGGGVCAKCRGLGW